MYHSIYREMADEAASNNRADERRAFVRSIELLKLAQIKGCGSRESIEALFFATRLWTILLEDLAEEGNGFPDSLKASVISIGIWVLRRAEEIRQGKIDDFSALIEVSQSISNGLEAQ